MENIFKKYLLPWLVSILKLPVNFPHGVLDIPIFKIIIEIILFDTFIETGTAFIHSINERVAEVSEKKASICQDGYDQLLPLGS